MTGQVASGHIDNAIAVADADPADIGLCHPAFRHAKATDRQCALHVGTDRFGDFRVWVLDAETMARGQW